MGVMRTTAQLQHYYFHSELFGMEDGMEHGVIIDFQIDKNGLLWVHTINNLQLFDGKNFTGMNDQIPSERIRGTFSFGISPELFFLNDRDLVRLNTDNYLPGQNKVLSLPAHPDSGEVNILFEDIAFLYISHPNDTLYKVDKGTLKIDQTYRLAERPFYPYRLCDVYRTTTPATSIVYISEKKQFIKLNLSTGKTTLPFEHTDPPGNLAIAAPDTLITFSKNELLVHTPSRHYSFPLPAPMQDFAGDYFLLDGPNKLLVALKDYLYEFDLRKMRWTSKFHKVGGSAVFDVKIRDLLKDAFGNLYFADFNRGLIKLYPRQPGFQYLGIQDGKTKFAKNIRVSEKNNLVLMGTLQDGLFLFDTLGNFKKQYFRGIETPELWFVRAIVQLSEDRYVIIGDEVYELLVKGDTYDMRAVSFMKTDFISYYCDVFEDQEAGLFLVHTGDGIITIVPEIPMQLKYDFSGLVLQSSAVTKFGGGILTVSNNQLLYMERNMKDAHSQLPIPDFGYVRCMVEYQSGQILLGTDLGLYLIEVGDTAIIRKKLYSKIVYDIQPGAMDGEFWFSTDYGLFRLAADFKLMHFSKEAGLQENEFNTNSSDRSPSGKLYFGGVNGITAFYPTQVAAATDQIFTYVSSLSTSSGLLARYIEPNVNQTYKLSYRESNIEIDLLGKGRKSPSSYNYQYQMKGLSPDWIDMGRNTRVNFHLAPGTYTFYYTVSDIFDPDAIVDEAFTIIIQPPFYKRWWFVTSGLLGILGASLYLFIQHKKKQTLKLMYEYQLNEKLQKERMRISRELHDNIGAQMATVKRNINFLVNHIDYLPKEEVQIKMLNLESISTQINQELRDTIWATQSEHISVSDFITRIKNYVFQTLGQESAYRVIYEERCDTAVILGPFLALNLHRICQETLNNAFKHSGASELTVTFEGNADYFKVTIRDNGKGFDMEAIHEGYGVGNIKHRSAQIGASLYFNRGISKGSSLEVIIERLANAN